MEDPNTEDFDNIFREIMEGEDGPQTFGAVGAVEANMPTLFEPRSVEKLREEMLLKDPKADVDHLTEFDVLLDDMNGVHAQRMNEILGNMNNSNFVVNFQRLLNYTKPKLKSIDAEAAPEKEANQINVTVYNSKDELNGSSNLQIAQ